MEYRDEVKAAIRDLCDTAELALGDEGEALVLLGVRLGLEAADDHCQQRRLDILSGACDWQTAERAAYKLGDEITHINPATVLRKERS